MYCNYLAHYGVKGQQWNHHDMERKWQNQARYAAGDQRHSDGTPITYSGYQSPETVRGLKRDVNVRDADAKKNAQIEGKKAVKQANKDAKSDFDLQLIDRGSKSTAFKWSAKKSTAANVLLNSIFGNAINLYSTNKSYSAYKARHGKGQQDNLKEVLQLGNRQRRIDSLNKEFDTKLSKRAIKKLNLSKEYVDAYSAKMDSLLNDSKNIKKINKLNAKNEKIKVSNKSFFNHINESIGGPGVLTGMSLAYNNLALPSVVNTAYGLGSIAYLNSRGIDTVMEIKIAEVPQLFPSLMPKVKAVSV